MFCEQRYIGMLKESIFCSCWRKLSIGKLEQISDEIAKVIAAGKLNITNDFWSYEIYARREMYEFGNSFKDTILKCWIQKLAYLC